jgi:hypothetical protein
MPFSGGGGGALPAHVHNSVPLQGGPLDFANDTIASLNVGSTTFSDGAALQELVIGNPADTLVVNGAGTAPEWGAAGGSVYELVGTTNVLVVAPNGFNGLHLSFTAIDMTAVTELIAVVSANRGVNSLGFLWNGVTSGYAYGGSVTSTAGAGTAFGGAAASQMEIGHWQVGTVQSGILHLTLNENDNKINAFGTMGGNDGGSFAGGTTNTVNTTCDSISFVESAHNMPAGNNRLTVYKVSR